MQLLSHSVYNQDCENIHMSTYADMLIYVLRTSLPTHNLNTGILYSWLPA